MDHLTHLIERYPALAQMRDKEYCEKLKKENVTQILAVGINYDSKAKEHQCLIEPL